MSSRRPWRHVTFTLGVLLSLALITVAVVSLAWTPTDPLAMSIVARLQAPSSSHPFGTAQYGRDVLARVMAGARTSITVGVIAGAICAVGRPGDPPIPGGRPRRGRPGLSRPRHPAAAALVGLHAEGRPELPGAEPVLRALPRGCHRPHRARSKPSGGWAEGPPGSEGGVGPGVAKSGRVDFCNTLSLPYARVLTRQCWRLASQTAVLRVTETERNEGL